MKPSISADQGHAQRLRPDDWVAPLRASGAEPPLFCVVAGGGDIFDYRDLADALPRNLPIYAFAIPPLDDAQFPTVEQIAATCLRRITEIQPEGPYRLCGHSFGGIVAYEMAIQLAQSGREVELVAMIDTQHPRLAQSLSVWRKLQFRLDYLFDRFSKYADNLLKLRLSRLFSDMNTFVSHHAKLMGWKISRRLFDRAGRRVPDKVCSNEMIVEAAWSRYIPGRYFGPILLLNAKARTVEYNSDPTLGWRLCAAGPIKIHVIAGDHVTIMHPPNIEALAAHVTDFLKGAAFEKPTFSMGEAR